MPRPACLLVTACATLALAAPAAAQQWQPGFALSAVGFDSYFRYRVEPGGERRGALRLANLTGRPLTLLLRPADVTTAATGGLQYASRPPGGDARWLALDRRRLRLAAGGAQTVGFRLQVPEGAGPGDHFAGIVALNARNVRAAHRPPTRRGLQLRFLPRLAIAVQSTIPGGHRWELRAGNAGIEVTPSATNATLQLRNSGNRLIRTTSGDLALLQGSTLLVRHYVDLDSFVPNTPVTLRLPFEGTPAHGTYQLRGTLQPARGKPVHVNEQINFDEGAASELRRETGREAKGAGVPLVLAAVTGAAGLLMIVTLAALLSRQRRQSTAPAAATPEAQTAGRRPSRRA
jgi:hypothetical protein